MDEPDEFGPQGEDGPRRLSTHVDQRVLPAAAGPRVLVLELGLRAGRSRAAGSGQEAVRRRDAGAGARPARHAAHDVPADRGDDLAAGRRPSHATRTGSSPWCRPLANDARLWPAGTLYSSANEMARLLVALVNDGKRRRQAGAAGGPGRTDARSGRRHPDHQPALRPGPVPDRCVGLRARRDDDRLRRVGHDRSRGEAWAWWC